MSLVYPAELLFSDKVLWEIVDGGLHTPIEAQIPPESKHSYWSILNYQKL